MPHARPWKRAIATAVCAALVATLGPVASGAAADPAATEEPTPPSGATPDADAELRRALEKLPTNQSGPVGGLHAIIVPIDSVRASGIGSFEVDVAQRATPGIEADDVRVTIAIGAGVAVDEVAADDWTCETTDRSVKCDAKGKVNEANHPGSIGVHLSGSQSLEDGTVDVKATVTWAQRADAAYRAAGQPWPAKLGNGARVVTETDVNTGQVQADGSLRVRARVVGPTVHPVQAEGDVVVLEASTTGVEDTDVRAEWRQACRTQEEADSDPACDGKVAPVAGFDTTATDLKGDEWSAVGVRIPAISEPTPFAFEVTVKEGGTDHTARVGLIATPVDVAEFDPRLETLRNLQAQGIIPPPEATEGLRQPIIHAVIGSRGITHVRKGESFEVSVKVPGYRIADVDWRAERRGGEIVDEARLKRTTITVDVPRKFPGNELVIAADIRLVNGRRVEVDEIIRLDPPKARALQTRSLPLADPVDPVDPAEPSAQPSPTSLSSEAPSASPSPSPSASPSASPSEEETDEPEVEPICAFAKAAADGPVALGTAGTLTIPSGALPDPAECTGSTSITLTGARIELGVHAFVVNGTITEAGVAVTGGTYLPPAVWSQLGTGVEQLTLSMPAGTALRAALADDGSLGALGGIFDLPAITFVPLPQGWAWQPGSLAVDANGLEVRQSATGPGNQAANLLGKFGFDGALSGTLSAQNIGVFTAADGKQISLSGTGSVSWKPGGSVDFSVKAQTDGEIVVVNNVSLKALSVEWTPKAKKLSATAVIGAADNALTLAATGEYTSSDEWSLSFQQSGTWTVADGIAISGVTGSLSRASGHLVFTASGAASGWSPSPYLTNASLSATITNACPKTDGKDAKDDQDKCEVADARLDLAVAGTLDLRSVGGASLPFQATANVNLKTWEFTVTGGVQAADGSIGPKELALRNITVTLTNTGAGGTCTLPPTPRLMPRQGMVLGFTAQGTVSGAPASFVGSFGDGLCLVGAFDGGTPSWLPKGLDRVVVAYSSKAQPLVIDSGLTMQVPAKGVAVGAAMTLPPEVSKIGLSGRALFTASLSAGQGFTATIAAQVPGGTTIFRANDGTNLALDSVDLSMQAAVGRVALSASVRMSYVTVAGGTVVASSTPLKGTVAFGVDSSGPNIALDAGVDTERAPGGVVENAFGTAGLRVRALHVSAKLGVADISLGFAANVTLPDSWGQPIGILPGSQVILDANISKASPCLNFEINRPPGDTGFAVDLANSHTAYARDIALLLAPSGCTIGSVQIAPGFGMTFDAVIAQKFPLRIAANVRLPSAGSPGFAIKADLNIGAFDVGSVKFQETRASIDLDTAAGRLSFAFSGGVSLAENYVRMNFSFSCDSGGNVTASGTADAHLAFAGVGMEGHLKFNVVVRGGSLQTLQFNIDLTFWIIGIKFAAQAALDFDNGVLRHFRLGLYFQPLILVLWNGCDGWVTADYAYQPGSWRFTLGWDGNTYSWYYNHFFDWGWKCQPDRFNWIDWSGYARQGTGGGSPVTSSVVDDVATVKVKPGTWTIPGRQPFAVRSVTYGIRTTATASMDAQPRYAFAPVMTITGCTSAKDRACRTKRQVTLDPIGKRLLVHPANARVTTDPRTPTPIPGDVVLSGKHWQLVGRLANQAATAYRLQHPDAVQQLVSVDQWPGFWTTYDEALAALAAQQSQPQASAAPQGQPGQP